MRRRLLIGVALRLEDGYLIAENLTPGGAAEKSGKIKPGDRIQGIGQGKDGTILAVAGLSLVDAIQLIRGPSGTIVRLEVLPGGEEPPKIVEIVRDAIPLGQSGSRTAADGGFVASSIFTHIVYFGGKGDFEPKSKTSLCRRVGKVLMDAGIPYGVQRSRVENGKLIGAILTNDPKGCQAAIDAHPELQFLRDERLTEQSYQVYRVYRGEDFLPPADGGFRWLGHQYIVTFKAKEGFTPQTERELFGTIYRSSTFCAQFKMRKDGDQIFGTFITDDPDELKIVIEEDPKLEYVGAERLTKESFEAYRDRWQVSLPGSAGQEESDARQFGGQ